MKYTTSCLHCAVEPKATGGEAIVTTHQPARRTDPRATKDDHCTLQTRTAISDAGLEEETAHERSDNYVKLICEASASTV